VDAVNGVALVQGVGDGKETLVRGVLQLFVDVLDKVILIIKKKKLSQDNPTWTHIS
jgi:hypothetical protein